ncbi:MAG: sigma 54-interacting transcriptional regulator [Polyangiaceae bacterium]
MARRRSQHTDVAMAALQALAGPAVVLDGSLRVRGSTGGVRDLLGFDVVEGVSLPSLLCGSGPKRPVAEAMAAGTPVQAVLPWPGPDAQGRALRVRSMPIGKSKKDGWVVLLEVVPDEDASDAVLFHGMWTRDAKMKRLFKVVERAAADDVPVLVRGETGSGKELVAQALHALSPRAAGPFRAINCAALPANLLESELFGHARGAFTGAHKDTPGHFQLASGGTLFLDEIAEMPLDLQAKLLRVLEAGAVIPVGGRAPVPVDVRIVSATHRALRQEVESGRFRADLMYRLRVIPLFLPPLRERRGDVPLLVEKVVEELNRGRRRRVDSVSPAAMLAMERYAWPGNVRELRNVLAYAYVIGEGTTLELTDLPPEIADADRPAQEVTPEPWTAASVHDPEAARIARALERARGNREQAARLLGMSRVTLWRRMRELGVASARA